MIKAIPEQPWPQVRQYIADAFIAGAQYALSHQWVSVEERLPEEGQEVLLYDVNSIRHYVIGWRRKKGDNKGMWALSNGFVEDKDITHWLPIPQLNPEKQSI
ncbi:DUF551 domain-containing protein [Paramuribaculum intestinale]|uniref:DUF551 domain-containing protein n=1 Tax=Paramuribaculum intestinale TaxID=2094151 RepID=UPI0025A99412|nr:DUF551 domain-containing protein [Paramuribaculum intestinale]